MDDTSVFQDKTKVPTDKELIKKLDPTYKLWVEIKDFVMDKYPNGSAEWNYPGKKFGWSYRIKDKKRVIIYFLPREHYFKVAFVFGQKATDEILESNISDTIKNELKSAKVYAEGRGIRIEVKSKTILNDIKKLVTIKLAN